MLQSNNAWYETFEHAPVRTSEEAAKIRTGYSLEQGAKAIIIRAKFSNTDKRFLMLVIPANLRFDNKKVKEILSAKDIRFATEDEVVQVTNGVLPGGVPPFGSIFNLEVIVDSKLFDNEKIIFNAGDRSFSIGMFSKDYLKIEKPRIESFAN